MSGLKFTLTDVTPFLPDNLSGLKKNYIQACYKRFENFGNVLIKIPVFSKLVDCTTRNLFEINFFTGSFKKNISHS